MKLPESWTTVSLLSKILVIILFVSLPFLGFYLGNKYLANKQVVRPKKIPTTIPSTEAPNYNSGRTWTKPVSYDRAIPIVKKDNKLYWYSMTKKQLYPTKYRTSWGGGYSGYGDSDPLPSPDGKFIAFINYGDDNRDDSRNLYILPAGSDEAIKITDYPVGYINSWSTDSSKILFYSSSNNLDKSKDIDEDSMGGDYPLWDMNVSFNKEAFPGFHSFNIENGIDTFLYPLSTAEMFVDKNRILIEMEQKENKNRRLVLFNVDTFAADFTTVNYPIKSSTLQKSFSADGAFWARTIDGGTMGGEVKIMFSKFPNDEGDIVDAASWATIQRPILNSDGKYLAYNIDGEKIKEGQFAGQYSDNTIIWDTTTKKMIKELKGHPRYWVDAETLLIGRAEYGNVLDNFSSFDLFNIKTQTTDVIPIE